MTRHHKKPLLLLGATASLAVALGGIRIAASAQNTEPFPGTNPSDAPLPAYDYDAGDRAFVIEGDFGADSATVSRVQVVDGPARTHLGDPGQLDLRLKDAAGTVVEHVPAWDPRATFVEEGGAGGEGMISQPGPGMLTIPFDTDVESMVVYDTGAGHALTTADLTPAIRAFCLDHPHDDQCVEADLAVTGAATSGVGFAAMGASTAVDLATTVADLGPDGPVDAVVKEVVTAPAGVSVTPASATWDATGLTVGTPQAHHTAYDVGCVQAGLHTVTFTTTIRPVLAKVADLTSGNDTATARFTVDCAVPVKLDVKPGNDVNTVSTSEAAVPMAVLTTRAGEFGLPLPFDATKIKIASVRIGNRDDLAASGTGVPEMHRTLHKEDVVIADGDKDGVLHAAGPTLPVTTATTELCVRGVTTSGLSFFGCDRISVVP